MDTNDPSGDRDGGVAGRARGFLNTLVLFVVINIIIALVVVSSRAHRRHAADGAGAGARVPLARTSSVLQRLRSVGPGWMHFGYHHDHHHADYHHSAPNDPAPPPEPLARTNTIIELFRSIGHFPHPDAANGAGGAVDHAPPPPPIGRTSSVIQRLRSISRVRFRNGDLEEEEAEPQHHQYGRSQSESTVPAREYAPPEPAAGMAKSPSSTSKMARRRRAVPAPPQPAREEPVDANAENFIHRFRQQLKLERLESILSKKQMK